MTDANRRTVRTVVAYVVSVAAALPLIVDASGVPETTAGVGTLLAVGAAVTRILALDVVDALLPAWLRKAGDAPSK
ncbi:hypothetical protein ACFCZT_24610 [Streptomyces sp. NPDC056230]|uniref:hypothetical protein n=1 Tax=Streptomyces sp. NPDC056230 TaxID=3345754 RepID=UPI0035D617FC